LGLPDRLQKPLAQLLGARRRVDVMASEGSSPPDWSARVALANYVVLGWLIGRHGQACVAVQIADHLSMYGDGVLVLVGAGSPARRCRRRAKRGVALGVLGARTVNVGPGFPRPRAALARPCQRPTCGRQPHIMIRTAR